MIISENLVKNRPFLAEETFQLAFPLCTTNLTPMEHYSIMASFPFTFLYNFNQS